MNLKVRVISMAAVFFTGSLIMAQQTSRDTLSTEKTIEEVVVTGYRAKKTDEIIQAQSVIGAEEMKQQSNSLSLTNMLQGKAPGVFSQTTTGQPGAAGNIQIRGISNFGNTQPLIVIDGQYSSIAQMNTINPNDVESQVILKDAAATAQYGARAAAGVIVITTKSGGNGKTTYSFESRFGTSKKVSDDEFNINLMDAAQKLSYENEIAPLVGNTPYTAAQVATLTAQNHRWEDDVLKNSTEESYYFSARGGDSKNTFFYSLGYDSNSGIVKYLDGLKRYTGRFNYENQLNDKIRVGFNGSGQFQTTENQRDLNNGQNPFAFLYQANQYESVFLPNGNFNPTSVGFPVLEALQTNTSNNKNLRINANVFGEYKFTNWLKFRSSFYNTYAHLVANTILKPKSYLDVILGYNGQVSRGNNDLYNFTTNQRLDFEKSFGEHKVNATAFYEYSADNSNTQSSTGRNYKSPGFDILSNTLTPTAATGTRSQTRRTALAGLVDYGYAGKYLLSGSLRRDGSSRFGIDDQFGTFYSASAGWNVARENFVSDLLPKLRSFKLRGSYGIAGNDAPILDYVNQPYVVFGTYGTNGSTAEPTVIGNTAVKFEKVAITNYGVDFNYANRFRGSAEYFINKRTDFLQQIPYPTESGNFTIYDNAGEIENKGYEIDLSADIIKSAKFLFQLRANYTNVKNIINELRDGETERNIGNANILKVGQQPYLFRLVKSAGVNSQNGDALYYTNRTVANPNETFVELAGGRATNVYSTSDIQIIYGKSSAPKAFGGFGATFTVGNFDVVADFTYKYGGYSINYALLNFLDSSQFSRQKVVEAANFWRNPGDVNVLAKPNPNGLYTTDDLLQKTDFIRFRSLNVGYTFSKKFLGDALPLNSMRVYLQGQNLYLWSDFVGDPEQSIGNSEGNTDVPGSYSLYTYPTQRTFTFGIDLNF